jgi:hypothetical protein
MCRPKQIAFCEQKPQGLDCFCKKLNCIRHDNDGSTHQKKYVETGSGGWNVSPIIKHSRPSEPFTHKSPSAICTNKEDHYSAYL